jgi:hypothetical protein
MLDLFCGRFGWGRAFAARGWEVVGVDLVEPLEIPQGCEFVKADILMTHVDSMRGIRVRTGERGADYYFRPDFICASSPCEQFSVHGMKHFHPSPPYPELGIGLFNHTREICESSGVPYVMENVRPAQKFVGHAANHCGPFYLWGNAVPPLMHQGITKGIDVGSSKLVKAMDKETRRAYRAQFTWNLAWSPSPRGRDTAKAATIPPELANCVAAYAERLMEQKVCH